jgi:hypothetical protein
VLELYPTAALRLWRVPTAGYKAASGRAVREAIRERLLAGVGMATNAEHRELLAATDHALDALVAALVGRAVALGCAAGPDTPDEREAARIEGWIWLPSCPLEALRVE